MVLPIQMLLLQNIMGEQDFDQSFHQRKPSITQGLSGAAATFFYMNQAVKTLEAITPDTIRSVGKNLQVCSRDQHGSLLQA